MLCHSYQTDEEARSHSRHQVCFPGAPLLSLGLNSTACKIRYVTDSIYPQRRGQSNIGYP